MKKLGLFIILFLGVFLSQSWGQYSVNFEGTGETKTAFASGDVTLSSLSWNMTEALIGTDANDWKNGSRSARLRGYGTSSMTMLANKSNGIGTVSFSYRRYGTDTQVDWKVEYSTNDGTNWTQVGSSFTAPASNDVQTFSQSVNVTGNVRIRIKRATESGTSNRRLNIDDIAITNYTSGSEAPTLTADNTDNTVDNNIDITFTDDATWRAAVTGVKIGGTALTVDTDYTLSAGNLQLKPSGGNVLLTASGSKSVSIEATGYTTATVTQVINAGTPTTNSTAAINQALGLNATRTVTCTARDQYSNLVSGYSFKFDVDITNNDPTNEESYIVDGTPYTSNASDVSLVAATNASGVATFTIQVPATVDGNDGLSVQVQLSNGATNIGSAFSYSKTAPQITITGTDPAAGNFQQGSTSNIVYRMQVDVVNDNTTLSGVDFITDGNYQTADIANNGFKLWYSADATLTVADVTLGSLSSTSTGTGEVLEFTGLSQLFNAGTAYLFLTVDVAQTATIGRTIQGQVTANGDFTFSGSPTFSGSTFPDGNSHNISAGQSTLSAGDIAIIAYATDAPDRFAFITFVDINPNTQISFTDNGWNGTALLATENTGVWQAPEAGITKGTIITVEDPGTGATSTVTGGGTFTGRLSGISSSGDQIFAYQGTALSPTFICGISTTAWITEGSPTSNQSYLPTGLTNGSNAIAFSTETDNGYYSGTTTGTYNSLKSKIYKENQWTLNDALQVWPTWSFTINTPHSANVHGTGNVQANVGNNTGVGHVQFNNVTNGGSLSVDKIDDSPVNVSGVTGNVSTYRWIMEPTEGLTFNVGDGYVIRFNLSDIPNHGIPELAEGNNTAIQLYKRSNPGNGAFSGPIALTYHRNGTDGNQSDDYLTSGTITNGFSEFVFGSESEPLPVELASLTASVSGKEVVLSWTTKTEINSNRFEVERLVVNSNKWESIGEVAASGNSNSPKEYSFTDKLTFNRNVELQYRLKIVDNDGTYEYSKVVNAKSELPNIYSLSQNYPNPFNPSTVISYQLPEKNSVTLKVYNVIGSEVATLVNEVKEGGSYSVTFNASKLSSGTYFYTITIGQFTQTRKLVVLK